MSTPKYRISRKAIQDLETIWEYTFKTWSKQQADRYYKLILEEIQFISDNYSTIRSVAHIKKGYRMSKVKSHLIFCRKDRDDVVEVIRILHQRMGIKNRLKE